MKKLRILCAITLIIVATPVALAFAKSDVKAQSAETMQAAIQRMIAWRLITAHVVENQPAKVGWEKFVSALHLQDYLKANPRVASAAKDVKHWPTLRMNEDKLIITPKQGKSTVLEPSENPRELLLDGKIFRAKDRAKLEAEILKILRAHAK